MTYDTATSRRDFLKASAAGVTFALSSRSSAFAADSPVGGLRWGIVGTGARSKHHIDVIKTFPNMKIIAACDIDEKRLQERVKQIGYDVKSCIEYRELLANADIDAVLICAPNMFHKEILVSALQAEKHVMCEKPIATNWEDCKAMKAAQEKSSRVALYTLQLRYAGRYRQMKELIQAGKIGAPQYALLPEYRGDWNLGNVWQYTDPKTGEKMNWRFSQTASGGTLNEKMCHYFDIVSWMLDATPVKVLCNGGITHYKDKRETWDHASVHVEYPNNVKALFSLCMFAPKRLELQIIGEKGMLKLLDESIFFEPTKSKKDNKREEIPLKQEADHGEGGMESAMLRMYEDFADCVNKGKKPFVDIDKAMPSSKIAWLAELSAQRGKEVGWDEFA